MLIREDNTYNDIREKSMRQWLEEMSASDDLVSRGGAKLTLDYLEHLNRQIKILEEKNALKDKYLKKMKSKCENVPQFIIKQIATIHSDFPSKFGIPRQSGLVKELKAKIVFEPEYRDANAVRGLEGFTHLWLIWQFSEAVRDTWSPTVKPPRLGGNERMGVFATRSPFRPNPLGLSCVQLEKVEMTSEYGPVLHVAGADLLDGTPIYDIKPYLPQADCQPEAIGGFADQYASYALEVEFPEPYLQLVPQEKREALIHVLSQDPRPSYQNDPDRIYGMEFADLEVKFTVDGKCLTVYSVEKRSFRTHEVKWKSRSE